MSATPVVCDARCRVMSVVTAVLAGGLFGAGLLLSGMTEPAKVVGFLQLGRGWDPSLAFVMGGAVVVYAILFRIVRGRRQTPWFDRAFHIPTRRDLDLGLLLGSAIFGIGWGLGGLCPGPGLVAAAAGAPAAIAFVAAMFTGMFVQHLVTRPR